MTIIAAKASDGRSLQLDSADAQPIANWQAREMTLLDLKECEEMEKAYGSATEQRTNPTPVYNCHGLTFGGRRTRIYDPAAVTKILTEDKYALIPAPEVKLGDVIVYYGPQGDVEHSGIVVSELGPFGYPRVCSKWGNYRELLHYANICQYSLNDIRYYRVRHD